jgi:hypothetical protein
MLDPRFKITFYFSEKRKSCYGSFSTSDIAEAMDPDAPKLGKRGPYKERVTDEN